MTKGTPRSPGMVLVLCFITFGLYYFYFMYVVTEEVNRYTGRNEQSPMGDVLLAIVTCMLWDLYWDYKIAKRMAEMTQAAGLPVTDNAVLYLVLDLLGFGMINVVLQQETLNRIWQAPSPYYGGGGGGYPRPPGPYYRS